MNTNFGRVTDGQIKYAPDSVVIIERHSETSDVYEDYDADGNGIGEKSVLTTEWTTERVVLHPTAEDYAKCTPPYLPNENRSPVAQEGQRVSSEAWDTDGSVNFKVYTYEEIPEEVSAPRKWSRLSIKRAAVAAGLWDDLKAMMVAAGYWEDEFVLADYIKEDDPMFVQLLSVSRERFGDETVQSFLNSLPVED